MDTLATKWQAIAANKENMLLSSPPATSCGRRLTTTPLMDSEMETRLKRHKQNCRNGLMYLTWRCMEEGCSDLPPSKVFKPKFNLAKLTDYKGVAPASYWGKVPFKQGFPGDI